MPRLQGQVLLVEDNPINLVVARAMLKSFGLADDRRRTTARKRCAKMAHGQLRSPSSWTASCRGGRLRGRPAASAHWRRTAANAASHVPIVALTANAIQGDRGSAASPPAWTTTWPSRSGKRARSHAVAGALAAVARSARVRGPLTALVVDDQECDRMLIRRILELRWQRQECASGEAAIRSFAGARAVTLVILDGKLPGLDGIETRQAPARPAGRFAHADRPARPASGPGMAPGRAWPRRRRRRRERRRATTTMAARNRDRLLPDHEPPAPRPGPAGGGAACPEPRRAALRQPPEAVARSEALSI
ncbi:MAG: response regulator [Comamonadaceae bacterium]|nr:response regulator [Comamonadaceae bacterium]